MRAKILIWLLLMIATRTSADSSSGFIRATELPDVSGFAWVRDNLFLVVHDAKSLERGPRLSLLKTPVDAEGILWKPLVATFPDFESNDLESMARIPGTDQYLLCESTEQLASKPYSNRIFLAELQDESILIKGTMAWPLKTLNIEGTALTRIGRYLIFIFAERAHGRRNTEIKIGELCLNPLSLENIRGVGEFIHPYPVGGNSRPVSAIAVDSTGTIYIASAEDPDDDNGPFSSAVYQIGKVSGGTGSISVTLLEKPLQVAILDGMKVEGLAIRELPGKSPELFVGLDDENYGGTVRPIRLK